MKTAIVFFSLHHGNTKKLVEAIAAQNDVTLIDLTKKQNADLTVFDRIGFASGIYFGSFSKQMLSFASDNLPEGKEVFFINTCGNPVGIYFNAIRKIADSKKCKELGAYQCLGFDTFGPFILVGGIAKGHPTDEEIEGAVNFYRSL